MAYCQAIEMVFAGSTGSQVQLEEACEVISCRLVVFIQKAVEIQLEISAIIERNAQVGLSKRAGTGDSVASACSLLALLPPDRIRHKAIATETEITTARECGPRSIKSS